MFFILSLTVSGFQRTFANKTSEAGFVERLHSDIIERLKNIGGKAHIPYRLLLRIP